LFSARPMKQRQLQSSSRVPRVDNVGGRPRSIGVALHQRHDLQLLDIVDAVIEEPADGRRNHDAKDRSHVARAVRGIRDG